jgi:hypothetical protein
MTMHPSHEIHQNVDLIIMNTLCGFSIGKCPDIEEPIDIPRVLAPIGAAVIRSPGIGNDVEFVPAVTLE